MKSNKAKEVNPKFVTTDFEGIVYLKDWLSHHNAKSYNAVAGKISILSAMQMVGFDVNKSESNWVARVAAENGEAITILGCQIRAVSARSLSDLSLSSNVLHSSEF